MNRFLAFGYIILGVIVGYGIGVTSQSKGDTLLSLERLLILLIVTLTLGLWFWFESGGRERRLKKWDKIRTGGKWRFIVIRYMIIRGILVLAFLFVPAFFYAGASYPILLMLAISIVVVSLVMAYIGNQEWLETELAYHERATMNAYRSRTETIV
jgi:hypothetical protein